MGVFDKLRAKGASPSAGPANLGDIFEPQQADFIQRLDRCDRPELLGVLDDLSRSHYYELEPRLMLDRWILLARDGDEEIRRLALLLALQYGSGPFEVHRRVQAAAGAAVEGDRDAVARVAIERINAGFVQAWLALERIAPELRGDAAQAVVSWCVDRIVAPAWSRYVSSLVGVMNAMGAAIPVDQREQVGEALLQRLVVADKRELPWLLPSATRLRDLFSPPLQEKLARLVAHRASAEEFWSLAEVLGRWYADFDDAEAEQVRRALRALVTSRPDGKEGSWSAARSLLTILPELPVDECEEILREHAVPDLVRFYGGEVLEAAASRIRDLPREARARVIGAMLEKLRDERYQVVDEGAPPKAGAAAPKVRFNDGPWRERAIAQEYTLGWPRMNRLRACELLSRIGARIPEPFRLEVACFVAGGGLDDANRALFPEEIAALGRLGREIPADLRGPAANLLLANLRRPRYVEECVRAIGRFCGAIPEDRRAEAVDAVLPHAASTSSGVRGAAAVALGDLFGVMNADRRARAAQALLALAADKDPRVAKHARGAMRRRVPLIPEAYRVTAEKVLRAHPVDGKRWNA